MIQKLGLLGLLSLPKISNAFCFQCSSLQRFVSSKSQKKIINTNIDIQQQRNHPQCVDGGQTPDGASTKALAAAASGIQVIRCFYFFIRWDQLCLDLDKDQGCDPNDDDSEEANAKIGINYDHHQYSLIDIQEYY